MFLERKWFFFLDADKGATGDGDDDGDSSDDKGDDTDFLNLGEDKDPSKISEDSKTGLSGQKNKKKADDSSTGDKTKSKERPDYIPESFWNTETNEIQVEPLAKALKDTQGSLTRLRGEQNVPEDVKDYFDAFTFDTDGQLRYSEGVDRLPAISKDDPLLVGFLGACHKYGVPVDKATSLVKDSFKLMDGLYSEPFDNDAFTNEQNEILGVNYEMQTKTAIAWIESLYTQGTLNLNEAKALHRDVAHSAHGVMALNKLRAEVTGEAVIPVHEVVPEDGLPTQDEWYEMKMSEKYMKDPEFKKKVDDLLPKVYPGTGNADFRGKGMRAIAANDLRKRQKKSN